jgi:16S rRNA (cytosine967-C5)-methyltransferase
MAQVMGSWQVGQRHNLPDWLANPLRDQPGRRLLAAGGGRWRGRAPLDLRVNALKAKREEVQAALAEAGITAEPTPYAPWGLRIQGKPA